MNMNVMNLLIGKTVAQNEGVSQDRALQLGLVASMMPSILGVVVSMTIARREAPVPAPPPPPPAPAPPPPPPSPPPETVEDLFARTKAEYQRLKGLTRNAVVFAERKLREAQGTPQDPVLKRSVDGLRALEKTELPNLDPSPILVPVDQLLGKLRGLVRDQAKYALELDDLVKDVEEVVIEPPPTRVVS